MPRRRSRGLNVPGKLCSIRDRIHGEQKSNPSYFTISSYVPMGNFAIALDASSYRKGTVTAKPCFPQEPGYIIVSIASSGSSVGALAVELPAARMP